MIPCGYKGVKKEGFWKRCSYMMLTKPASWQLVEGKDRKYAAMEIIMTKGILIIVPPPRRA